MTNKDIGNNAIEFAIARYLREGETRAQLIKQFDGDSIRLVQFLRSREFAEFAPTPPVAVPEVNTEKVATVEENAMPDTHGQQPVAVEPASAKSVSEPEPEPIKTQERIEQIKNKHDENGNQLTMF